MKWTLFSTKMVWLLSSILLVNLNLMLHAELYSPEKDLSQFPARISRINKEARLLRLKIEFDNVKYLNKADKIQFWNPSYPKVYCMSYLVGKSNEFLLIRVPEYEKCVTKMHMSVGTYLHLQSDDLKKNIKTGKELGVILSKKRFALEAMKKRLQKELEQHVEKLEATNERYEILRQKLELEWQQEISKLQEDKSLLEKDYFQVKARLDELDYKIDRYKIDDKNFTTDRWALDSRLYLEK